MTIEFREIITAAHALASLLEKTGEFYMEEVEQKRWLLGDGGSSGNCETCEENADLGFIDMDDVFTDVEGSPIDDVPAHPNDTCTVEFKTRRQRVYV